MFCRFIPRRYQWRHTHGKSLHYGPIGLLGGYCTVTSVTYRRDFVSKWIPWEWATVGCSGNRSMCLSACRCPSDRRNVALGIFCLLKNILAEWPGETFVQYSIHKCMQSRPSSCVGVLLFLCEFMRLSSVQPAHHASCCIQFIMLVAAVAVILIVIPRDRHPYHSHYLFILYLTPLYQ